MNRKVFQTGLVALSFLVFSSSAFAVRGRPHIDSSLGHNLLLSDQNTLLRGVSLSFDGGDPYDAGQNTSVPTQAQLNDLATDYGLNTVHLYLEGDSSTNPNPIGYNEAKCNLLVDRCANAGLYLIITIGCNGENGTMDLAWSQDFWEYYAPLYKDETHVIYEAHNEPVPNTLYSWDTSDWNDQAALYDTIRTNAPDTFILLGSFMGFVGDARPGANYLVANGVSWSNAGFAHHGYESKVGIEEAISYMETSTNYPALLCTEFGPQETASQGYNSMYESHFNGWMQFQWLEGDDFDLYGSEYGFKTRITQAGTIWIPDVASCDWPVTGSPSIPAHGSMVGIYDRGAEGFIRINGSADLVADLATYTGTQGDLFIIEDAGDNMISLKATNGLYVSTSSTGDSLTANKATVGKNEQFIWYELSNGDVALRAYGGGGHLIRSAPSGVIRPYADNGRDTATHYTFVDGSTPTGPPADPAPYNGTPMAIPGIIEAEDFNNGGEGGAYHDTNADNQGGRYRTSEWVDIENCNEGGYDVGWTEDGEWMEYTVDVATAGIYTLISRVAGAGGGGAIHIEADDVDITGSISIPDTGGWQTWVSKTTSNVTLDSGRQVIRIAIESGGFNLNRIEFVLVQALNDPPVFTSDPIIKTNALEDSVYNGSIAGDASDPDGDPLIFSVVAGGPAWLTVETNGVLSGTPGDLDTGLNSWTVQVSDGTNSPASATLQITVDDVNYDPTFTADPVVTTNAVEGVVYSTFGNFAGRTLADWATDDDAGDTLSFSKVSGPAWLSVFSGGRLGGTPGASDVGLNSWTVQVSDGNGGTDTATLEITVDSDSPPPVLSVHMSGSSLEILWPSSYTTYNLYGCTNLVSPVVWSSVTNIPVIEDDSWMVTMPPVGSPQFFRLQAP